ncbi:MAG TPA: amidohydrolase [Myxococcales bacterium LLY-WYZ-16_1]|nr:amidohydrolase [Myxococcales bacterium LLY-WYZ-16_1]
MVTRGLGFFLIGAAACAASPEPAPEELPDRIPTPYARPAEEAVLEPLPAARPVLIEGGTIWVGDGTRIEDGAVLLADGRVQAVGRRGQVSEPDEAFRVDAQGRHVTPGLVDTHSHMGVYPQPGVAAHADGNEMTDPTTPYVFSEHAFWPQDPAIEAAVAGGVTTIQVLPGSGNVIGGRSVTLKLHPRRSARVMRFPGAPFGLKMACGENPKRVYGSRGQQPMSRMGNIYKLREAFLRAREYRHRIRQYSKERAEYEEAWEKAQADPTAPKPKDPPNPPKRDLGLETLADVLDGEIRVHIHCYRADEMVQMLALADELGFEISTFHHAVEAYKIADVLADRDVHAAVWADWWGFKVEAYDTTPANAAILAAAGATPNVHSDSPIGIQRLSHEAAKALAAGRRMGLDLDEDDALRWITLNPAKALGIDDRVGTLERGKMADVVVWTGSPFSIYSEPTHVFVDGHLEYERDRPSRRWSDFLRGTAVEEVKP